MRALGEVGKKFWRVDSLKGPRLQWKASRVDAEAACTAQRLLWPSLYSTSQREERQSKLLDRHPCLALPMAAWQLVRRPLLRRPPLRPK